MKPTLCPDLCDIPHISFPTNSFVETCQVPLWCVQKKNLKRFVATRQFLQSYYLKAVRGSMHHANCGVFSDLTKHDMRYGNKNRVLRQIVKHIKRNLFIHAPGYKFPLIVAKSYLLICGHKSESASPHLATCERHQSLSTFPRNFSSHISSVILMLLFGLNLHCKRFFHSQFILIFTCHSVVKLGQQKYSVMHHHCLVRTQIQGDPPQTC